MFVLDCVMDESHMAETWSRKVDVLTDVGGNSKQPKKSIAVHIKDTLLKLLLKLCVSPAIKADQ